ncbi:MAG: RluA family pseudouridine synthase [Thermodesulfobacterium sp.]|nr:RluA family pseudouridine synthase [Thermodesulfobacterium sp.]
MSEVEKSSIKDPIKTEHSFVVEDEAKGERLDVYLRAKLFDLSRERIKNLIEEGFILVEGKSVKPSYKLKGGEQVLVRIPVEKEYSLQPKEVPFEILYEDEDLAVIYKPAGIVVHPAPGHLDDTLVHGLLLKLRSLSGVGGELRPGIVHRLDKDTSGVMLVAKNDFAHKKLTQDFKERRVEKEYLAIVYGKLTQKEGTLDFPIGRHPVQRKKMAVLKEGRQAITKYKVLRLFKKATLVLAKPLTGRTHQLRVHFSHIGHPILGDPIYGGLKPDVPRPERLMLHAYRISFEHPRTGAHLAFTKDPPEDFEQYLKLLETEHS